MRAMFALSLAGIRPMPDATLPVKALLHHPRHNKQRIRG
jgi:hypothetical protein